MKNIATLDIEASGLHRDSYPIEIGIAFANGDSYCSLIKPDASWSHWCHDAEKIHGISQKILLEHGKPIEQVAAELNRFLRLQTLYSDCWVLDNTWLEKLFSQAGVKPRFKLRDIIHVLTEEQYLALSPAKKIIAEELKLARHRATNDARILQQAYKRVKQAPVTIYSSNNHKNVINRI